MAMIAVPVACALGPVAVAAPSGSGTWGPSGIPYLAGQVCDAPGASVAMVAWPSPTDGRPAYALDPVVGPSPGSSGGYVEPAVDGVSSGPPTDLSQAQQNALAYLLTRYGSATQSGDVAAVAAAVATVRTPDARVAGCSSSAAGLWSQAVRLAGPYSVHVTSAHHKIVMGQPDPVTALVTAASGAPVPGVRVRFAGSATDAAVSPAAAVTDSAGRARSTITVPVRSATKSVQVRARADVPGTVSAFTAPREATLVAAGPPRTVTGALMVPVDLTADPVIAAAVSHRLVLPGMTVATTARLRGMRGHVGAAALSVAGPLPYQRTHGCSGYRHSAWQHHTPTSSTHGVAVIGDGTLPAGTVTPSRSGCYLVSVTVATKNAVPNLTRRSGGTVLTVAPVSVTLTAADHGVSLPDRLHATVAAAGSVPAHLAGLSAHLVGPRPSVSGSCGGVDWTRAPDAGPLTLKAAHNATALTSRRVRATGCYAFAVDGSVVVPGAGSIPVSMVGGTAGTVLVLQPITAVVGLSSSSAPTGGHLSASVSVSGTYRQAGALQLRLLRLPYDWRGCFGRDWSHAQVVTTSSTPAQSTEGDGTYSVPSPKVPSDGCWTVLPVFTLKAVPAVHVIDTSVIDPTLAFTGFTRDVDALPPDRSRLSDGSGDQLWLSGLLMLALVIGAAATTATIAVRSERG